jgi:hypothetical protein
MTDQTENTTDQATTIADVDPNLGNEATNAPDMEASNLSQTSDVMSAQSPNAAPLSSAPAEDSGEAAIKKEEAVRAPKKAVQSPQWRQELKRFHNDINGILAAKENYKLVCVDQNAKPSFAKAWKQEANRYFQLIVNLRRRAKGAKVGGKNVA